VNIGVLTLTLNVEVVVGESAAVLAVVVGDAVMSVADVAVVVVGLAKAVLVRREGDK
jgi:ABC-type nickel/cobalt efflux system permease component RcnA